MVSYKVLINYPGFKIKLRPCQDYVCQDHVFRDHDFQDQFCQDHVRIDHVCHYRGVARGGAEGARSPTEFGKSVKPGGSYAPHTIVNPPDSKRYLHLCITMSV